MVKRPTEAILHLTCVRDHAAGTAGQGHSLLLIHAMALRFVEIKHCLQAICFKFALNGLTVRKPVLPVLEIPRVFPYP